MEEKKSRSFFWVYINIAILLVAWLFCVRLVHLITPDSYTGRTFFSLTAPVIPFLDIYRVLTSPIKEWLVFLIIDGVIISLYSFGWGLAFLRPEKRVTAVVIPISNIVYWVWVYILLKFLTLG